MKRNITAALLFIGLTAIFMTGCVNPIRKEMIGIWKIEDVKLSGDTSRYDPARFLASVEDQKKLRFEMLEDSSMAIYTGSAKIEGKWRVERRGNKVFMTLKGNVGENVMGNYHKGKLVSIDTTEIGAIITTTFIKEVPEQGK